MHLKIMIFGILSVMLMQTIAQSSIFKSSKTMIDTAITYIDNVHIKLSVEFRPLLDKFRVQEMHDLNDYVNRFKEQVLSDIKNAAIPERYNAHCSETTTKLLNDAYQYHFGIINKCVNDLEQTWSQQKHVNLLIRDRMQSVLSTLDSIERNCFALRSSLPFLICLAQNFVLLDPGSKLKSDVSYFAKNRESLLMRSGSTFEVCIRTSRRKFQNDVQSATEYSKECIRKISTMSDEL